MRVFSLLRLFLAIACLSACGGDRHNDPAPTVASARVIRGTLTLEREGVSEAVRAPARVEDGATATASSDGRASVVLDTGAWLLLDHDASITLALGRATLGAGRLWVDASEADETTIETAQGTFTASGGTFAIALDGTTTTVYCGSGEITYRTPQGEGSLPQGETLTAAAGAAPRSAPEALWEDWTGGLVDPTGDRLRGVTPVGALNGRTVVERSQGVARAPLPVRSHEVNVEVRGDLAVTEVVQTFFNARSETLEGEWAVRLPEGAIVQGFAVDMGGGFVDAGLASVAVGPSYQLSWADVSTPISKLTWDGPDRLRARVYPITAGATVRVRLRYTSWLDRRGGVRTYVYPMRSEAESPMLGEFVLSVDTRGALAGGMRAGMGAISEEGRVVLRRSDFRPRADFYLDLYDAAGSASIGATAYVLEDASGEDEEHDYVLVDIPTDALVPEEALDAPLDLVLVVDVSGDTDPEDLEIARAVVEAVLRQLAPTDRVALRLADVSARAPEGAPAELSEASADHREALLGALGRVDVGGATDLGESLRQAATLVAGRPRGAVLYLGDALPTTGALDATSLRRVLGTIDAPPRMFGMAIGDGANADLLRAIFGERHASAVRDRRAAAHAVMEVLAEAARATLRGVAVDLGAGVERIYPRGPLTVGLGEHIRLVGRVVDQLPSDVTLRGTRDGEDFESTMHVGRGTVDDGGDVRRRWASARLAELLDQDAGREALVELGTRFGLVTPWTSLVVGAVDNTITQLVQGFDHDPLEVAWGLGGGGAYVTASSLTDDELGWRRRLARSHTEETAVAPETTWAPRASAEPPETSSRGGARESDGGLSEAAARRALIVGERGPRQCYERRSLVRPDLSGSVTVSVSVQADGSVRETRVASSTLYDSDAEQCITTEVQGLRFPSTGSAITVEHTFVFLLPDREFGTRRTCSEASRQPLETRRALWSERLAAAGSGVTAVLGVWRAARGQCELSTWQARRTLLEMMLGVVGDVRSRVQLYQAFSGDAATAGWLRRAILRRLRTPEEVTIARAGLGLEASVEWDVFSRLWWRDREPRARLALVRRWLEVAPDEMDLRLRLLSLLEETGALPEARRVARELRADPLADAKVRTEVGEFWLRQSEEGEARRVFSEIVERAPLDPWARRRLGDLYRAHAWADDSYREYETLARLRPGEGDVLLLLSRAAAAAGRIDEALRLEQRLSEATETGADEGAASSARLWTLVRLFSLWSEGSGAELTAIRRRLRETGALRDAPDVLVALTFPHPDDRLALSVHWPSAEADAFEPAPLGSVAHGVLGLRIQEREPGEHLFEIRREERESLRDTTAELWVITGPGTDEPRITRQGFTLTRERLRARYRLGEDGSLAEAPIPPERATR